jgi:predicted dehydrogenase
MSGRAANKAISRLAIIGCGAVAEFCHLPGAKLVPEVEIAVLVDKNMARAEMLAEKYGVEKCIDDYHNLPDDINGVIIGLPHFLHAPATIDFLKNGLPALVEKPMARNTAEAEAMIKAAEDTGVALQIGLMYRFANGVRQVKRALEEGWLGPVRSFTVDWGFIYDWPVASGFFFSKEQAGGGVLIDLGSHVLDLLLWWLGDVIDVAYKDDSMGGVEADCWLSLALQGPTGPVEGTVTLSRLRDLTPVARIVGDHFTIECDLYYPDIVRLWPSTPDGNEQAFIVDFDRVPRQPMNEIYAAQLRAFAHTIKTGGPSAVPGEQVLGSVALIDRCYQTRQPLAYAWAKAAA